jgi:hypothetical protein
VSERDLQVAVLEAARLFGWRVALFRPARAARGWRTPVEGDGAGFPDLLLLRGERLLVRELKAGKGRLGREQLAWLEAFRSAGVDAGVWREDGWDQVECRAARREAVSEPLALALPPEALEAIAARAAELVLEQLGNGSPWMSREAAARYLSLPVSRLEKDASKKGRKEIPLHRPDGRVLYHRDELDAYLSSKLDTSPDPV